MRDPHVVALLYRVETEPTLVFDNPPPVEHQTNDFDVRLAGGVVTVTMHEHHASEESARRDVDQYLRGWEITAGLQFGRPDMRFVFDRAEVIDRAPPKPGTATLHARAFGSVTAFGTLTVRASRRQYPEPPADFTLSPDVESMWRRFEGYLRGREPLLSMAYFCRTVLTTSAKLGPGTASLKPMEAAATVHQVDLGVLLMLNGLTNVGDESTARKKHSNNRPLRGEEVAWIEAVIRALIRRAGERAANPSGPHRQLTMADFPPL